MGLTNARLEKPCPKTSERRLLDIAATVQYSTVHTGTPSPSSPFTAEISTVVVAPV
eukprot:COSAG01_NODE_24240_length_785_cov_4.313411_2_plen_55_part_01